MASTSAQDELILVEKAGGVRKFILNRPRQLNALSRKMISQLLQLFLACMDDHMVKLVIVKGNGRAFSAGGDAASVAHDIIKGNWTSSAAFFHNCFSLTYLLATYSKPQVTQSAMLLILIVSILNGIVMGGGAGVSIHGRFRVATENSVFAMPETALGLFPDVGASYFLSRLPGFFGEYVGLTGTRLDGAEMLACGLATHFVSSEKLPALEEALCRANSSDPALISAIINGFSQQPYLKDESAFHQLDVIDRCFSKRTIGGILLAVEKEAVKCSDEWISAALKSLRTASPMSLKLSLRSVLIREGRLQGIGQCVVREYRMICNVLKGEISKDFVEAKSSVFILQGCRSIFFDKDKNPKWNPSKFNQISESMVDRHFLKLDDEGWEDLKLPPRFNLPAHAIAKL
ncbi:Enoyl-CoA hydratase/isomerase domain [Dillenia turbinata]|uniref:3-hydroxyisobutyryl-CoA hydrolase n=1 Tax=Dillenia turbinata TaxID=194707 RepID=A0AAN8YYY0_9MAGN